MGKILIPKSLNVEAQPWNYQNTKDIVMVFGKYKGQTLLKISNSLKGMSYLAWLEHQSQARHKGEYFTRQLSAFVNSNTFIHRCHLKLENEALLHGLDLADDSIAQMLTTDFNNLIREEVRLLDQDYSDCYGAIDPYDNCF